MACFIVPAAEAAIVTLTAYALDRKAARDPSKTPSHRPLHSLAKLLWGGSALLAFEHLWHGEIQPFYPFLTAAGDPAATEEMLHEMSTVGVSMAVCVTMAWGIVTLVRRHLSKAEPLPARENA